VEVPVSGFRCAAILCTTAIAPAVASAGTGDRDSGRLASASSGISAAVRRSPVSFGLSKLLAKRLDEGIPVAQKRLRDFASCRALFSRLGADGAATLSAAAYHAASAEQERRYCGRGVEALATVGGSAVALCRGFAHLSGQDAAIILIHEALHLAGQPEAPATSGAPDSRQLTEAVIASCQLL
jgi:hypothetical protein